MCIASIIYGHVENFQHTLRRRHTPPMSFHCAASAVELRSGERQRHHRHQHQRQRQLQHQRQHISDVKQININISAMI